VPAVSAYMDFLANMRVSFHSSQRVGCLWLLNAPRPLMWTNEVKQCV